jgi:hypothetical protein
MINLFVNSKRKFIAKSENNGKLLKNKRTLVRRVFNSNLVRCFVPNQPIQAVELEIQNKISKGLANRPYMLVGCCC